MTTFGAYLGKGLDEPCPPYRIAEVFGAPLNSPDAGNWNCLPRIMGPTKTFDLSVIPENHEVVVALLTASSAQEGTYRIRFRYYKLSPHTKLFEYTYTWTSVEGGWFYAYAYIGRVSWEINENGAYYVEINVSGPDTLIRNLSFSVSGIKEEVKLPVPEPISAAGLVDAFNSARYFFYDIYVVVNSWIWPFSEAAEIFYSLARVFGSIAQGTESLVDVVNDIIYSISGVMSWSTIWSKILTYVPNLIGIRNWFYDVTSNIVSVVNDWWYITSNTVQGWIQEGKQLLQRQIDQVSNWLAELESALEDIRGQIPNVGDIVYWWRNWQGNVQSAVESWWTSKLSEVQGLVSTAFIERESWWAGWSTFRDQVATFFSDPLEYIWSRFTDWFLGPEV